MQTTTVQKHRPVRSVVESTLQEISATLERSLFAEEISTRPGLLQSLDPRVKVISTLALLIGVSLSRSLAVIAALYVLALPGAPPFRRVFSSSACGLRCPFSPG